MSAAPGEGKPEPLFNQGYMGAARLMLPADFESSHSPLMKFRPAGPCCLLLPVSRLPFPAVFPLLLG